MQDSKAKLSRRDSIKMAMGLGVISTAFATTGRVAHAQTQAMTAREGLVSTYDLGAVKLHNYTSPAASALVNTLIIETQNEVRVIDAQMVNGFAQEARTYAESLGKPIRAVYLTHAHVDHVLGASAWNGIDFISLDGVVAEAGQFGEMYEARNAQLGNPAEIRLPEAGVSTGATTWDGVDVIIGEVKDAESASAMTLHIPGAGLLVAGDLFYSSVHAFPLANMDNWIAELEKIKSVEGLSIIAGGHGLPAAPGALQDALSYLSFREGVIADSSDAETAAEAILKAYPGYGGEYLVTAFLGPRFQ